MSVASPAELTTEGPIGQGSQFTVINRGRQDVATITVFERPERLEFAVASKGMDIAITYIFADAEGRTTAVGTFAPEPKGFLKAIVPLLMPLIRRDLAKQHVDFKKLCETRARSARRRAVGSTDRSADVGSPRNMRFRFAGIATGRATNATGTSGVRPVHAVGDWAALPSVDAPISKTARVEADNARYPAARWDIDHATRVTPVGPGAVRAWLETLVTTRSSRADQ